MNPRKSCIRIDNRIEVNETKLDIYEQPTLNLSTYEAPVRDVKSYEELTKCYIDIETSGLEPENHRVYMIGLKYEDIYTVISSPDESEILASFTAYIRRHKPDLLVGHNVHQFDFPFLITRAKINQVFIPFYIDSYQVVITNANLFGGPITFFPTRCMIGDIHIVDTMQQLAMWDFVNAQLTKYNLKDSTLQLGLRDEARTELSYQQMLDCWKNGNLALLREYLCFDLDDTELLTNFLLPSVYYQLIYVPDISFQDLATKGQGGKWTKIIRQFYSNYYPTPDDKCQYEGGYTYSIPGIFRAIAKVDVSSLYPSIMLNYGIWTRKDPKLKGLSVLSHLTKERLRFKQLAKTGDSEAESIQAAVKVLINSGYGALGTTGAFNDYEAAALVTAYGRKIVKTMADVIEHHGGTIIEVDTDGIIYTSLNNRATYEAIQKSMPPGINVEYELEANAIYVPLKGTKNYIIHSSENEWKGKGVWRKRDRAKLEFYFVTRFLSRLLKDERKAKSFYDALLLQIENREVELALLKTRKKRAKGNRDMEGLCNVGEYVECWVADAPRFHKTTKKPLTPGTYKTLTDKYSVYFYQKMIKNLYDDIMDVWNNYGIQYKKVDNNS